MTLDEALSFSGGSGPPHRRLIDLRNVHGKRTLTLKVKFPGTISRLTVLLLRAVLVATLLFSGWLIYAKLPHRSNADARASRNETTLQIRLRPAGINATSLDIPVELYPVDIVAV